MSCKSSLAIAALTAASFVMNFSASATETAKATVLAQANPAETQKNLGVKKPTSPAQVKTRGVSNLASHDCRMHGTIVEITDNRCGSSHQYCKFPDGVVECIEVKD
jgi:putative hemolysin